VQRRQCDDVITSAELIHRICEGMVSILYNISESNNHTLMFNISTERAQVVLEDDVYLYIMNLL
jgi:hypothetical protein